MVIAAASLSSSSSPSPSPYYFQFIAASRISYRNPIRSAKSRYRYFPLRISATAQVQPAEGRVSAPSHYDVLGIPLGSTVADIKAVYRRLARTCHPDVAVASGGSSAEAFNRIHAAYSTLSDPDKRAEYDRTVLVRRPMGSAFSSSSSSSSFRGFSRRTWETDQCW